MLGLVGPGAVLLLIEQQRVREEAMASLKNEVALNARVLALSMVEPLWQVSPELAKPLLDAQFADQRYVEVLVRDASNSEPLVRLTRDNTQLALSLTETVPITREGREIGKLTLTMTAQPLLLRAQADLWKQAARTLLLAAMSMGVITWMLRRRVLRPMERLAAAAAALGAGHLDRPLPHGGNDEIGKVSEAMERMRKALLEAFDRLRQHASTLEEQVAQRTSELTTSNDELKLALAQLKNAQRELVESEKLASLGRLVAGVAHELNTPLGNALTVVTALEDRWGELSTMMSSGQPMRRSLLEALVTDTRRGQDILLRNVRKAADLVRDFKQVAVDQTSDARRSFDLAQVVSDVLVMVEPRYKNTPYQIKTDLAADLMLNSFPGALGQALTNLLINALVHGFDGRDHGTATVSCRADPSYPNWVQLSVRDDGAGMSEEVRRRMFDPFFTTKLGQGGTGLGMHIVHTIVTQMLGGQIEVSSEPGRGTLMTLRLPCVAPERSDTTLS